MRTVTLAVMLAALLFLLHNVWSYPTLVSSTEEPRKIVLPQRRAVKAKAQAAIRTELVRGVDKGADDLDDLPPERQVADDEPLPPEPLANDAPLAAAARGGAMVAAASEPPQTIVEHVGEKVVTVVQAVSDGANAAAGAVNRVADQLRAAAGNAACKPEPVQQGTGVLDWKAPRPLNWVLPLESSLWPLGCETHAERCTVLRTVARHRELILTLGDDGDEAALTSLASQLRAIDSLSQLLLVSPSPSLRVRAKELGVGGSFDLSPEQRAMAAPARKWAVLEQLLRSGASVLFCSIQTRWLDSPFGYLFRDSDLELASTGSGRSMIGSVVSVDDAEMGWSRYAQSLAIAHLSPELFYAAATTETVHLAVHLQIGLQAAAAEAAALEPHLLTDELLAPAHDRKLRAGASLRVMSDRCFGVGRGSVASAPASAEVRHESPQKVLASRDFSQREEMLHGHGCKPQPADTGQPAPRRLNWVVSAQEAWPPMDKCRALDVMPLCETVARVAIGREVIAAVSNKNIFHMLQLYVNGIKAANISNALVVALDEETSAWLAERQVNNYVKVLRSRSGGTDNHATSGLKFKVLVDFLSIGCSVLLSDVDVIWLANPFPHIYRDADLEGMSDGWDTPTTYGYNWGGSSLRVFARNSGMFYVQATHESNNMMKRLAYRMEHESTWDQTAYNEEQFYPSNGRHGAVGVTSRAMNYLCNFNSKTFFRFVRDDAELLNGYRPLSMHVNYHPEKPQRMVDLHNFYYNKEPTGIHKWNGGEGSKLGTECAAIPKESAPRRGTALVDQVIGAGKAEWGGIKWIEFNEDGSLSTPWGSGRWGEASTPKRPNTIFAYFIGQTHLLKFEGERFTSVRCSDGEEISGQLSKLSAH